jgi:hypothetical protein
MLYHNEKTKKFVLRTIDELFHARIYLKMMMQRLQMYGDYITCDACK